MLYVLRLIAIVLILSSCNSYQLKYPYSLADFRPELRRQLEKIITFGVEANDDYNGDISENYIPYYNAFNFLSQKTSIAELQQLVNCQHPLLRAAAFNVLCRKNGFKIDKILLNHLDDTAAITYVRGEFGETKTTVSDFFIIQSSGHTNILSKPFIETVIEQHPYLENAASFLLYRTQPDEKNYKRLKAMIEKNYSWHYDHRTEFIIGLSKYKKNGDRSFIAEKLIHWPYYTNETKKFDLIRDNPINEYFPAIDRFYRMLIHDDSLHQLQENFRLNNNLETSFQSFLYATAAYKTKESANILFDILNKKLYKKDIDDYKSENRNELSFKYGLFNAIKAHSCIYYKDLFPLVETDAQKFKAKYTAGPVEIDPSFVLQDDPSDFW